MDFSPQQNTALMLISAWYKEISKIPREDLAFHIRQTFYLAGYAGTGKTTLAKSIAGDLEGVYFAAYTGKAAHVLSKKGCPASTIHSLIYKVNFSNGSLSFDLNPDSSLSHAKLLIVDEVSMVDEELGEDLLSFGCPVLVLGDPAQLPPIKGCGYFTSSTPNFMLTEIHRQAADNPIIHLATEIRNGRMPAAGQYGESQILPKLNDEARAIAADQMIVGKNTTRQAFNTRARQLRGFKGSIPNLTDKLICLRNNAKNGLFNGSMWTLVDIIDRFGEYPKVILVSDEGMRIPTRIFLQYFRGDIPPPHRTKDADHFDYGYAITGHKSQGSQWDHVIVFDESLVFRADRWKWLYTAVTRAAEKVDIISRG